MTALAVTNVSKLYPGHAARPVLDHVSFVAPRGEVISLIGQNGAGKTTLIKIIAGLAAPSRGSVSIFGHSSRRVISRRELGYMPEQPQFFPTVTAWQWLIQTGGLLDFSLAESKRRAKKWLAAVGLVEAQNRPIGRYSKGMRQRLAFAQACLGDPQLLLLDEPLDGLDPLGRQDLKRLIIAIRAQGATVLLCSHILSDIAALSDRLGVIDRGQLRYFGPTQDFAPDQDLETAFARYVRDLG